MSWITRPFQWVFSFSLDHKKKIDELYSGNDDELKSWTLFTIILPLITFALSAFINSLFSQCFLNDWGKIFNNGSLPIIAFGIISSSMSYLVEKLDTDNAKIYFALRKRVTGVATLFLFITSALFLFESLGFITEKLTFLQNSVIFLLALISTGFAVSIGRKMYLLQSPMLENYDKSISKARNSISNDLVQEFNSES